ncbi:MAG: hypothetical protein ACRD0B_03505 [Acidimicrobiales bacterium]
MGNHITVDLFVAYNGHAVHQWMREHRLLDASHPDALEPTKPTRAPRRGRARRF